MTYLCPLCNNNNGKWLKLSACTGSQLFVWQGSTIAIPIIAHYCANCGYRVEKLERIPKEDNNVVNTRVDSDVADSAGQ